MTNIEKLTRMANEFHEEYAKKEDKVMVDISSDTIGGFPTVHMREEAFKENFGGNYLTEDFNGSPYRYKHYQFYKGVKFFCISRER